MNPTPDNEATPEQEPAPSAGTSKPQPKGGLPCPYLQGFLLGNLVWVVLPMGTGFFLDTNPENTIAILLLVGFALFLGPVLASITWIKVGRALGGNGRDGFVKKTPVALAVFYGLFGWAAIMGLFQIFVY